MATYPQSIDPTNPVYNEDNYPQSFDQTGGTASGAYLPLSGGALTGPVTSTSSISAQTITCETLNSSTLIEGEKQILNNVQTSNTIPAGPNGSILINPNSAAASGNDTIQAGDQVILFTTGSANSGALAIGPMTTLGVSSGLRMDSLGNIIQYNDSNVIGNLQVDGAITCDNSIIASNGSVGVEAISGPPYSTPAFGSTSNPAAMLTCNSDAGASNPLIQQGDTSILFQGPTGADTGNLVIAPSTGHIKGLVMNGLEGQVDQYSTLSIHRDTAEAQLPSTFPAGTSSLVINPYSQAGSGNPEVQAGDISMLFATGGAVESADLHIGPYTANPAKAGLRINRNGGVEAFSDLTAAGPFTVTNTSNQIVLGTTNTTTINSVAPAVPRIYTLPDAGAAASFIMSEGTQTINGTKTFGANLLTTNPTSNVILAGTSTQQTGAKYTFASDNNGNARFYIGDMSTPLRSARGYACIATSVDTGTVNAVNVDPSDNVRIINLRNQFSELTGTANRGIGMTWELWPSPTGVNTGRVYNDLTVKREAANSSSGSWNFGGFNTTFTGYATYHRLTQGTTVPSFICTQGTDNTVANQPGLSLFTQDAPNSAIPSAKMSIGNSATTTTASSGTLYGNSWDVVHMGGIYQNNHHLELARGIQWSVTGASALFTLTLTINITSTASTAAAMLVKVSGIATATPQTTNGDNDVRTEQVESTIQLQWVNSVLTANVVTNTPTYFDALVTRNINIGIVNPTASTATAAIITMNFSLTGGSGNQRVKGSINYNIITDTPNMITSYAFT